MISSYVQWSASSNQLNETHSWTCLDQPVQ